MNKMRTFKEYREEIQEATAYLNESFDKPFDKTEVNIPEEERDSIHKNGNIEDYKEYQLHDGLSDKHNNYTKLISYKREGAYEIHHVSPHGISGEIVSTGKSNPRFIATMFHHAKVLIDKGYAVRIIGNRHNGMFDHYHRITKALARKHDYVVSRPHDHAETSYSPDAHNFKEIQVYKKINESEGTSSVIIHNGDRSGALRDIMRVTTYSGKL